MLIAVKEIRIKKCFQDCLDGKFLDKILRDKFLKKFKACKLYIDEYLHKEAKTWAKI